MIEIRLVLRKTKKVWIRLWQSHAPYLGVGVTTAFSLTKKKTPASTINWTKSIIYIPNYTFYSKHWTLSFSTYPPHTVTTSSCSSKLFPMSSSPPPTQPWKQTQKAGNKTHLSLGFLWLCSFFLHIYSCVCTNGIVSGISAISLETHGPWRPELRDPRPYALSHCGSFLCDAPIHASLPLRSLGLSLPSPCKSRAPRAAASGDTISWAWPFDHSKLAHDLVSVFGGSEVWVPRRTTRARCRVLYMSRCFWGWW